MTTNHPDPQLVQTDTYRSQSRSSLPERQGTAGLVTAGAMTALLSGDVRLAIRATRLLIDDNKQASQGVRPRATRLRRVWRRPSR